MLFEKLQKEAEEKVLCEAVAMLVQKKKKSNGQLKNGAVPKVLKLKQLGIAHLGRH